MVQWKKKNHGEDAIPVATEAVPVPNPPTFLTPTGALNLSKLLVPTKRWELSSRISKHCKSINTDTAAGTQRHRALHVPIETAEIVVSIFAKKKKDYMKKSIDDNSLENLSVTRTYRAAILTRGTLQFKRLRGSIVIKNIFTLGQDSNTSIVFSIFDLRGFHVGGDNVAILAFQDYNESGVIGTMEYALYQTTDIKRFLFPLTTTVVAAYSGTPTWAIPITWSGNLPSLPIISKNKYIEWMGNDGGFSAMMYAAALAFNVKNKIETKQLSNAERQISKLISSQQPSRSFIPELLAGPQVIDITKLAKDLGDRSYYALAGLNALSFNLIFRKLKLTDTDIQGSPAFRQALPRALLYNVTLREVDFSSSILTGVGELIGNAWAMNAQPLVSRVNFYNCQLTDIDIRGLLHGLARIWCGGTALAESLCFAQNMNVKTETWDVFFKTIIDPSSLVWPKSPPPPPNLNFLQELDLRETNAIGSGLIEFVKISNGLKTLRLTSCNEVDKTAKLLDALPIGLESFEGIGLDCSCIEALYKHCNSLKEVTLNSFRGDAGSALCGWPQPMPNLSLNIGLGYVPSGSLWINSSGNSYTPASLCIYNDNNFGVNAMNYLSSCANGLKKLVVHKIYYWQLLIAAPVLTGCGLETLYLFSPSNKHTINSIVMNQKSIGVRRLESFWSTLAASKTLRDLQLSDQLIGGSVSNEVAMIGRFLKSNRSVQHIGFDSSLLALKVEDVKVLRSAFYGNKKIVDMEYLSKARQLSMIEVKEKTQELLMEIQREKAAIKMIFKSHYSKYDRFWRIKPNELKVPHVTRIRVAKREISRIQRESNRIGTLLSEIKDCVQANIRERTIIEAQKSKARLERREGQLQKLAKKKKKFVTNLVKKLNKAKLRGRKRKSAKNQIPRSMYYKSKHTWPDSSQRRRNCNVHSRYNYYNDPYYARYHWWGLYGFYDNDLSDDNEFGVTVDNSETKSAWDSMLSEVDGLLIDETDPWAVLDSLIHQCDSDLSAVVSPEFLAIVHGEASELGIDVVSDLCSILDDGTAVANKLDEIGASTNSSNEMLTAIVDSSLEGQFDLRELESTLDDIPEYNADDFNDGDDFDGIMDADDAVTMYAGAGPRDLDDGGPSFGNYGNAALAGARRRARARVNNRAMVTARKKANRGLRTGYKNLTFAPVKKMFHIDYRIESFWPNHLKESWTEETNLQQVQAMARSDLFEIPEAPRESICLLTEWTSYHKPYVTDIDVVLVSQCSFDRLKNLEAQLACWIGKASIAIYLKPNENQLKAESEILSSIKNTKKNSKTCDVAVTIIKGCMDDEPYPINYLRNAALLEARRQHLRFNSSLDNSAVLLVDIDFRASVDLHEAVHSRSAVTYLMKKRRVVVCAAFESISDNCVRSIPSLYDHVMAGKVEGFHISHFPQGHTPTNFDKFWINSLKCNGGNTDSYWEHSYEIQYEKLFEPYVIMASADVPLYDERFQGYGLNKVVHLASVAVQKDVAFFVLPGVFLIAPTHERSDSFFKRYGKRSDEDETKFNQLLLKGLYYNFMHSLEDGRAKPVVSKNTRLKERLILKEEEDSRRKEEEGKRIFPELNLKKTDQTKLLICY